MSIRSGGLFAAPAFVSDAQSERSFEVLHKLSKGCPIWCSGRLACEVVCVYTIDWPSRVLRHVVDVCAVSRTCSISMTQQGGAGAELSPNMRACALLVLRHDYCCLPNARPLLEAIGGYLHPQWRQ